MKNPTGNAALLGLMLATIVGACLGGLGCSKSPERPAELEQMRAGFAVVQQDPNVAADAPVALREAEAAVVRAERTWEKEQDVREAQNQAAVAKQRIEIARAAAEKKMAERELEELNAARERVLLEARTREAQRAQR